MRFISDGIGELVSQMLKQAARVQLASAYFSPSKPHLTLLSTIRSLDIVISAEFEVNNPHTLEKLANANRRSIDPDPENGKLHAKVLIIRLKDNSDWILLGSANITHQGMFSNREACIEIRSEVPEDQAVIKSIRHWYDTVLNDSDPLDMLGAKKIWSMRSMYRLVPRPPQTATSGVGYWVLKSTEGATGKDHWEEFLDERVVAIGWEKLSVDPSKMMDGTLLQSAIKKSYPDYTSKQASQAAAKIRKFVNLSEGDTLVICRGYPATQQKAVSIRGLARITGTFRAEKYRSGKWRFKHNAVVQRVDVKIPKEAFAKAIEKGSLMETIQSLSRDQFEKLSDLIRSEGASVDI